MYRIAICDDEPVFADGLKRLLEKIMPSLGIPYTVEVFEDARRLLAKFEQEQNPFDLLLLDIIMAELDGMELAEKIRALGNDVSIIFTTSSEAFSVKGYSVQALNYLMKPVKLEELQAAIQYDLDTNHVERYIVFKQGRIWRKISSNDILYLEIKGRKVAIQMEDDVALYSGKLIELEGQLPSKQFVRCHQSFVINLRQVQEISRNEAVLKNGAILPISRAYLPQMQKAFLNSLSSD